MAESSYKATNGCYAQQNSIGRNSKTVRQKEIVQHSNYPGRAPNKYKPVLTVR